MKNLELSITKISWYLTLLRPLNLIIIFLPLFFVEDRVYSNVIGRYIGLWMICFIALFFVQIVFIKRYKTIGLLTINSDCIVIEINGNLNKIIYLNDIIRIDIEYNGYQGDDTGNYSLLPLFFVIGTKEGIGKIRIELKAQKETWDILFKKNSFEVIKSILNLYSEKGILVNGIK